MADNTELDVGSGGDTIRTEDKPSLSAKVPVSLIDVGGTADSESIIGDAGVGMPVDGLVAENAAASGNPIPVGGRYDSTPRTLGDGDRGEIALDADGAIHIADGGNTITVDGTVDLGATDSAVLDQIATNTTGLAGTVSGSELQVDVVGALPAGTNAIGKLAANSGVDIGDVDVTSISAGTNLIGQTTPAASTAAGGTSTYYDSDLDETKVEVTDNPTVRIYSITAFNTTDAPLFLQLFDLDADNVTVGTTTPTNQYVIPGNANSDGAGFAITFAVPKAYSNGFTIACSTNSEGATAPGTGACIVNIEYVSAA